ncbi:hypothetical protein BT96DRAFT_595461 [Gymnopus androsaceus JB14]|uniref:Uncharacterized protein n=1 Tax=Gymnopus androsaceus JB14 TaxID=1447944 RepID=A0A6A4GIX0_9AGAR|nr:hypothetical protein BT96DRAFT_595461 [Gymnopus androsaceus JB14]
MFNQIIGEIVRLDMRHSSLSHCIRACRRGMVNQITGGIFVAMYTGLLQRNG